MRKYGKLLELFGNTFSVPRYWEQKIGSIRLKPCHGNQGQAAENENRTFYGKTQNCFLRRDKCDPKLAVRVAGMAKWLSQHHVEMFDFLLSEWNIPILLPVISVARNDLMDL